MEVSNYVLNRNVKYLNPLHMIFLTYVILLLVMDKTTESGFQPKYVAECILKSVLKQEKEVTIASFSPKCAIILRTLFPSLYFWIMQKRARKLARDK